MSNPDSSICNLLCKTLLKLFVIAWAVLVSKVYDNVSGFYLPFVCWPDGVSYKVPRDVIFFLSLDLSIFFRVLVLGWHHVCHVAWQVALGYFDRGRHFCFLWGRVFLCYDSAGHMFIKSLLEALKALGMTPDQLWADVSMGFGRSALQLRLCLSWWERAKGLILNAK